MKKIGVFFIAFLLQITITGFCVKAAGKDGEELSSFSTKYNTGAMNRAANIKRAADEINGTLILPGETFSFNFSVGPATHARGYKIAKTFLRGKETEGYGGGICQLSSTLYCAALEAGLTVTERHPHSKRVYYVDEGRDAATDYGGIDLKLRNDFDFSVVIFSSARRGELKVSLYALTE